MPYKARTRRHHRLEDLTNGQTLELAAGWTEPRKDGSPGRASVFASEDERLAVWADVRDAFLAWWYGNDHDVPWAEAVLTPQLERSTVHPNINVAPSSAQAYRDI